MKYAVVTGGAGFIGSHLVDRLIDDGMHVAAIDNLSNGRVANLERAIQRGAATFVYVDASTEDVDLLRLIREAGADNIQEVYHLSSPATAEETFATIELARKYSARYLFATTHEHTESDVRNGESSVRAAIRNRGLRGAVVRIFDCYGPRMELDGSRLVPALLEAALREQPLPIHGTGRQTHSMAYVDDIVTGLTTIARSNFADAQPFNLGTEERRTVEEIVRTFARVAGIRYTPDFRPHLERNGVDCEPPRFDRAGALGWRALTPLERGLSATYRWYVDEAFAYI